MLVTTKEHGPPLLVKDGTMATDVHSGRSPGPTRTAIDAKDRLILALDVPHDPEHRDLMIDRESARDLVRQVKGVVRFVKIGQPLYLAGGNELIEPFVGEGIRVFLDLKFTDIRETVKRAVEASVRKGASFITVDTHLEAVQAAVEAKGSSPDVKILTVTLLTSLDEDYLKNQIRSTFTTPQEYVLHKTRLARSVGCDGVIASGREAAAIRREVGSDFLIVTPGIRPAGTSADDQRRTATPEEAVRAGADYLVVGRPIARARSPRDMAQRIADEMQRAFDSR